MTLRSTSGKCRVSTGENASNCLKFFAGATRVGIRGRAISRAPGRGRGGASALAANGAAPLGSVRSTQRAASKEIDGVVLDGERGVRRLDLAGGEVGHLAAIEADHVMMMFGRAEHVPDQTVGLRIGLAQPRGRQGIDQTVDRGAARTEARFLCRGAQFLGAVPAAGSGEQAHQPAPQRGDAQARASQLRPNRLGFMPRRSPPPWRRTCPIPQEP